MKKLLVILTIVSINLFVTSCTKDNPLPQNKIETPPPPNPLPPNPPPPNPPPPIYTPIHVSIDNSVYHQLHLDWYSGDDDFGGWMTINGWVKLILADNNTRVYAQVSAEYDEYSSTGNTKARIDPNSDANKILLYTSPSGKKVSSINSNSYLSFHWYPSGDYHGIGVLNSTGFVHKIEMIGDTSGPDLPCDGSTGRSRFRIYFDDFDITITDQ
jgi:hypothetical protein